MSAGAWCEGQRLFHLAWQTLPVAPWTGGSADLKVPLYSEGITIQSTR